MSGSHASANANKHPSLIDDDTPTPPHARFSWARLMFFFGCGFGLWVLFMYALMFIFGYGTLFNMAMFFSKAALVTFGGAYAVLPYVFQTAVGHFQWLSAEQMIDGLALGETTPGPLIMVVAFVGYLGGVNHSVLGTGQPFLSGAVAASIVTFCTFLPSFVFILVGGPLVESTHGQLKFTAPLTAITAAVVGVILNLTLFFAWHVWWPHATGAVPFSGGFDMFAALLTLVAAIALFRFKTGIMTIIAVCGLIGLLRALLLLFANPVT
jgi:chromate transporter